MDRTEIQIELHEDGAHVILYKVRKGVGRTRKVERGLALKDVPSTIEEMDSSAAADLDAKPLGVPGGA